MTIILQRLGRFVYQGLHTVGRLAAIGVLVLVTSTIAFAQLSGYVFRDYNADGIRQTDSAKEPGVAGIKVSAYVTGSATPQVTLTDATGAYSFAIANGVKVRLEFSDLPFGSYSGIQGLSNNSTVQFVTTPNNQSNLGLTDPLMYCGNQQPDIMASIQVVGDALKGNTAMTSVDALVKYPYSAAGQGVTYSKGASFGEVGALWGSAYQRQGKKLFSAAVLKRHSGLGTLGLGGIYQTDMSGNTDVSSPYVDLGNFVKLAEEPELTLLKNRSLTTDYAAPATDSVAFAWVGKVGLGGMAFSPDESRFWVVNLFEKTLVGVQVGIPAKPGNQITAADITSYPIPTPDVSKGASRPWAVTYHEGALYVGVTTDASVPGSTRADLKAYVYRFDLKENKFDPTPVLTIALDYRKGWVHSKVPQSEYWESWSDQWGDYTTSELSTDADLTTYRISRPQPILSAIEFDLDGSLIIGLMDRTGHQTARNQLGLVASNDRYSGYIGGDLLRAQYNGDTKSYLLENNGTSGTRTSGGVGNNQGPGGGEFYFEDDFKDNFSGESIQEETFMGSLMVVPGTEEVVASAIEPLTTWSGGALWLSNNTGSRIRGLEIYDSNPDWNEETIRSQYVGNANGLGSITALCAPAPLQIGNRVWVDANNDGIQNPGEAGLAGVKVALYDENYLLKNLTTTDADGKYLFGTPDVENNKKYHIVFGIDVNGGEAQFNRTSGIITVGGNAYKLTQKGTGEGDHKEYNDSDAMVAANLTASLNGFPVITFETGAAGQNNPDLDAGFITCWADAGKDTTACVAMGTMRLSPAGDLNTWSVVSGNPANATISNQGLIEGMTKAGIYTFVLSQGASCKDTIRVTAKEAPAVRAFAIQPTCTDSVANDNGIIKVMDFADGDRFNISQGNVFQTPLYTSALPIPANGILTDTIPNPVSAGQPYTVRVYNEAGCTTDIVVTFRKKDCECGGVATICVPFIVKKTK